MERKNTDELKNHFSAYVKQAIKNTKSSKWILKKCPYAGFPHIHVQKKTVRKCSRQPGNTISFLILLIILT